ncbi:MAG: BTAD domain-containing putative transcriptional regulator, partial [Micromonosporaceae bacterium]
MEFRLLGSFETRHDGRPVEVGSRRQERCLLGILLLAGGQPVPVGRLLHLLWDGCPPETARNAVYTYVGRLRRSLSPYQVRLVTRHDGYLVELDGHRLDITEFIELARQAIAQRDPYQRVRLLDRALELWRGPLLGDVAEQPLRDRLGTELVELRLSSSELRAAAQLEIGHHDRVASDLVPLIEQHPTRERLVAVQMAALHGCGRRADALQLYRDTRDILVKELGIEPGTQLADAHQRILRNDPPLLQRPWPMHQVRVRGHDLPWTVGGHPALEFCNTYAGWGRPAGRGSEWLRDYSTLAVWVGYMDLADDDTVSHLLQEAHRHPDEAVQVLHEARTLRNHLYACLTGPNVTESHDIVARYVEDAAAVARLGWAEDGLARWRLPLTCGLRLPVYAAARTAGELLTDPLRRSIQVCASQRCGWLFLDR